METTQRIRESGPATAVQDDLVVMTMLHRHVPLALLCDLSDPGGPPSAEILEEEGQPESTWWEQ
ncbi:MAG: hypothetical protein ACRDV1_10395 [Actinomycetes bacterium]